MESNIRRGKGGRPKSKANSPTTEAVNVVEPPKSFKWTKELKTRMAEYLRENYSSYKASLTKRRKASFLRQMKVNLGIECTYLQIKNAVTNLLKKYEEVKRTLTFSGFGVDPDKDATLDKGWVLRKCHYFDILDEVLGCRPNVTPPATRATANFGDSSSSSEDEDGGENEPFDQSQLEMVMEVEDGTEDQENVPENTPVSENLESATSAASQDAATDKAPTQSGSNSAAVQKFIKDAVGKITSPRDDTKTPMGMFASIMSQKMDMQAGIEDKKLDFEERRFQKQIDMQEKQIVLESQKMELENKKLLERSLERDHELKKLQMAQDFELKKLQLQLKINGNNI